MSGTPDPERGPSSVILAIDSASEQAGLALFDGSTATELSWPAGRSQTTSLLAEIHHLLSLRGIEPDQLAGVAVTIGPGTFSGLRVGLSIAKGLVLGLGLPIVGVPTLDAAALPFAGLGLTVVALVPAGRGRIVWSHYRTVDGVWLAVTPPRNGTIAELVGSLPDAEPIVVVGEVDPDQAATLNGVGRIRLVPAALRGRRAAAAAAIAWDRLLAGETDDPALLEPVYTGRVRS